MFSRARGSAVAMPQAESCTLAGVARAYVCRQWQGLNRDFQSCCVALETFDVHAWVERNVTMESALSTYSAEWTQPQIDEAQKALICEFYARRLGNDVFWKRVYCKRHDVEMSGLPLIEMASAEEAVGAAQEASTEAMIASPWSESESDLNKLIRRRPCHRRLFQLAYLFHRVLVGTCRIFSCGWNRKLCHG